MASGSGERATGVSSRKPLTALSIAAERPGNKRREIPDGKISGLYFIVQSTGAKSWAFRYRVAGQPKKLTIGTYPAIDLASARKSAAKALAAVAEGGDPATDKRIARTTARQDQAFTVAKAVEIFIDRYAKPKTRESSWRETERLLKNEIVSAWGSKPLSTIERWHVIERLDAIMDRGATIVANRVLAAFRRLCNWAIERGIIERSPCAGVKPPAATASRDRILTDDELCDVWRAAGDLDWPFGPIVRLLILTGQRRGEVADMRWSEVDLDKCIWTIPRTRTKNGVEHVVALSPQAVEILRALPTIGTQPGFIFTVTALTAVSGHSRAKRRLDAFIEKHRENDNPDAGPMRAWVLHDLRRTVASGMARLGINLPIIEKVLNHTSGSFGGIVSVYQRHSFDAEKRSALEAWARHVGAIVIEGDDDYISSVLVQI